MKVQPTKIILINSANCQYAEFNLSDSLHLVALNNRGKTSIINTLQFLYIDHYKDLDFGYRLDDSWSHYFPNLGSYVLFELNTLTGKKVFGLSATGLGSQPEKFLLDQPYQVSDFITQHKDQFIPKKPEQLFPQLGIKLIQRPLNTKAHRDMLRPAHPKTNPLGLGLIGNISGYGLFKRLFRQLLQLKNITIKDLKRQIEKVNSALMGKEQLIHVEREFREPVTLVQRRQMNLERLKNHQMHIEDLLALDEKQTKHQGRLVNYAQKSMSLFTQQQTRLQEERSTINAITERLHHHTLPDIALSKQTKQDQKDKTNQNLGKLEDHIAQHERLEANCLQTVVTLIEESLSNLRLEERDLQKRLFNIEDNSMEQLNQALNNKQADLTNTQKQRADIENTLFSQLKQILSDDELAQCYRLINPECWTLLQTEDFHLHDKNALKSFIQPLLQQITDTTLDIAGLQLNLSKIKPINGDQFNDPHFLSENITRLEEDIALIQQSIKMMEKSDDTHRALQTIRDHIQRLETQLAEHSRWKKQQPDYIQWKTEQNHCHTRIEQCQQDIHTLDEKTVMIHADITQQQSLIQQLDQQLNELSTQKAWIESHPPASHWQQIEINYDTPTFSELYTQYKKSYENYQQSTTTITDQISRLREYFSAIIGLHDHQALPYLRQEIEAIPDQEKSIHDEWKRIFTTFSAHCREMIDGVDAINSYLVELNRLLAKQQISNLTSIKIRLDTNQWYRHILKIKEWKDLDTPLFGELNQASLEPLLAAIKPLLEKVKISFSDLYDLTLIVVDTQGQEKHYASLQLESNGTSITAKTIIFISMLNAAMTGKESLGQQFRLPFYVDEIDSLDDMNAENIHQIALKLGLIPIFASPKGSGICHRLYQLENNRFGKLSVRQQHPDSGKLLLVRPTFERVEGVRSV